MANENTPILQRKLTPVLSLIGVLAILSACTPESPSVKVVQRTLAAPSIVIQNVAVFDTENLAVFPGMDVSILNGKISAIASTGSKPIEENAQIVSGVDSTLVPGLFDMHAHVNSATGPSWEFAAPDPEANLRSFLYAGVTTVFDPSDPSGDEAFERREQVAAGSLIGPRIFTVGRMITHPQGHPRALIEHLAPWWIKWYLKPKVAEGVGNASEAIAAVNQRADAGADAIKIAIDSIPLGAPRLSAEIAGALVTQAKNRGLRTVAHVGTVADAIVAAEAGVALWVHNVYKEVISDADISRLASYGIPMVTTSEVFDRYGRAANGAIQATSLERESVPQAVLDSFYPIPDDFDMGPYKDWIALMQKTAPVRQNNVRRLHQAGVTVLAGSDVQSGVFAGASLHRELVKLVAAGLTPAQAIRAATLHPAQFLANGQPPDAGIIAVGKRADLILVRGDPSRDINALANIREVFLNGVPLQRTPVNNN